MGTMESIGKSDVELWVQHPLTNNEWTKIRNEIEGRLDNFIEGLAEELIQDYNHGIFSEDA
jgi:hypothetical protein